MSIVLLFVFLCALGAAVLMPRATRWYQAARVQHETDCLVSDLRLLQQMSRTASVHPIEGASEYVLLDRVPEIDIQNEKHQYAFRRRSTAEAGGKTPGTVEIQHHSYPRDIQIVKNVDVPIQYGRNGGTWNPMTIYIYREGAFARGKKIILDSVGRIRVEGMDGKTDG